MPVTSVIKMRNQSRCENKHPYYFRSEQYAVHTLQNTIAATLPFNLPETPTS